MKSIHRHMSVCGTICIALISVIASVTEAPSITSATQEEHDDPLRSVIVTWEFTGTTMRDVFSFVEETLKIPVTVDWPALGDVGVTADSPLTCALFDVPADTGLRIILEMATGDPEAAGFFADENGMTFTTTAKHDKANRPMRTGVDVERNVSAQKLLQAARPRLIKPNVKLTELLDEMSRWYGLSIVVVEKSIENAGVDLGTPLIMWNPEAYDAETLLRQLVLQVQGVNVRVAIKEARNAKNKRIRDLQIRIDDGVVVITRADRPG